MINSNPGYVASTNYVLSPTLSPLPRFAHRQDLIKWNGWGYNDSEFVTVNDEVIKFTGDRWVPLDHHHPITLSG